MFLCGPGVYEPCRFTGLFHRGLGGFSNGFFLRVLLAMSIFFGFTRIFLSFLCGFLVCEWALGLSKSLFPMVFSSFLGCFVNGPWGLLLFFVIVIIFDCVFVLLKIHFPTLLARIKHVAFVLLLLCYWYDDFSHLFWIFADLPIVFFL